MKRLFKDSLPVVLAALLLGGGALAGGLTSPGTPFTGGTVANPTTFSGDVTFNGGTGALGFGSGETLVPADAVLNVTGSLLVSATTLADTFQVNGSNDALKMDSSGIINIQDAGNNNSAVFNDDGTSMGLRFVPEAFTIADNGAGTAATSTDLPNSSIIRATCSDANGCEWTPTETNALTGLCVLIYNASANTLTMKHAAGQVLFPGAADQALGTNDSVRICYDSTLSAWLGETKVDR